MDYFTLFMVMNLKQLACRNRDKYPFRKVFGVLDKLHTFSKLYKIFNNRFHNAIQLVEGRFNGTRYHREQNGFFMNKTDVARIVTQREIEGAS